ncbi:hypothetical protein [Streptomyces leeuwenhoekii]|uniref:Secreted Serine-Rich Protein n=1 Tax=Streptomyces leeuwenhoekii TaxID=1437453 RepID=A0A0F7W0U0_STRLW|nr:hypothetical protein [Streptomyces leeuwenhoekii]CQR62596.1 Secreted Serine-Rich Protein [Streptomyces leeuwenhoekii]
MQRKAYVPGVAALLAAVLAGCTGGSGDGGTTDDANPGGTGRATAAAEPGRYRTLPEPCGAVGQEMLDSLLPGIAEIVDEEQREKAYDGEATLTYDTDRKVGCRWKVESADAVDHLLVDFERVVSYDSAVSDDSEAERVFATKAEAADLPEPEPESESESESASESESGSGEDGAASSAGASTSSSPSPSASSSAAASGSASQDAAPGTSQSPSAGASTDLQPRLLDDLGDEAFLDDELSASGSTAEQRTVTVAFRTSNVIVTIEYAEQPATVGVVPDSAELQDRARKLAARLADTLSG